MNDLSPRVDTLGYTPSVDTLGYTPRVDTLGYRIPPFGLPSPENPHPGLTPWATTYRPSGSRARKERH